MKLWDSSLVRAIFLISILSTVLCVVSIPHGVTGGWRKLHNEELHNWYSSPSIFRIIKSRRMRWAGHVARMEKRNVYSLLVGNPEGKRPLGRPKRRWIDNIKMELLEIGLSVVDWIGRLKRSTGGELL
jgi:hypothetical protein